MLAALNDNVGPQDDQEQMALEPVTKKGQPLEFKEMAWTKDKTRLYGGTKHRAPRVRADEVWSESRSRLKSRE